MATSNFSSSYPVSPALFQIFFLPGWMEEEEEKSFNYEGRKTVTVFKYFLRGILYVLLKFERNDVLYATSESEQRILLFLTISRSQHEAPPNSNIFERYQNYIFPGNIPFFLAASISDLVWRRHPREKDYSYFLLFSFTLWHKQQPTALSSSPFGKGRESVSKMWRKQLTF